MTDETPHEPDPDEPAPDAADPYAPPETETTVGHRDSVGQGVVQVLIGHACAAVAALVLGGALVGEGLGPSLLLGASFLGVYQWLYVVPLLVVAHRRGARQTAKGIWILAGVSMLPTCACFGLLAMYSAGV